jgi:hypothetical protein
MGAQPPASPPINEINAVITLSSIVEFSQAWGGAVAAVAASASLVVQLRGKRDSIKVGLWTLTPEMTPKDFMHIVNLSDHPVKISDYGFIEPNGTFTSIPWLAEIGDLHDEECSTRGKLRLEKRGDYFEMGYERRRPPAGAFAVTAAGGRPTIDFGPDMPHWRRLVIRLRLLFRRPYLG